MKFLQRIVLFLAFVILGYVEADSEGYWQEKVAQESLHVENKDLEELFDSRVRSYLMTAL